MSIKVDDSFERKVSVLFVQKESKGTTGLKTISEFVVEGYKNVSSFLLFAFFHSTKLNVGENEKY